MSMMRTLVLLSAGAAVGAALGIAYSDATRTKVKKAGKKALKKAKESFHRVPQPQTAVAIPNTLEDYAVLDELVCACADDVRATLFGGGEPDLATWARETMLCVLNELEPDVVWPHVPGDHPSILALQVVVLYEVSRQLQEDTLCLSEPDETMPTPNPGRFVRPR